MFRKKDVFLITALFTIIFSCCSANPEIGQVTHGTPMEGDYLYVWDSILEVFSERNIPITTLDEEAGIISSDWIVISEKNNEYCDCGNGRVSPLDVVQAKFNIFLEFITEGSTGIQIAALYQLNNKICGSTGKFESDILLSLKNKMGSYRSEF